MLLIGHAILSMEWRWSLG